MRIKVCAAPHTSCGNSILTQSITLLFSAAIEVMSKRGRTLLMYKNYTYSKYPYPLKHGWRWYCSKVKTCRAYLITTERNVIIASAGQHMHEPSVLNANFLWNK
ncbi:unnamed protein product, partial [Iphiclides podalirius]